MEKQVSKITFRNNLRFATIRFLPAKQAVYGKRYNYWPLQNCFSVSALHLKALRNFQRFAFWISYREV